MSAKIVLTDEDYAEIKELAANGSNQETIATLIGGFTGRTLRNIFKEDDKALSAYKLGVAKAHSKMAESILDRAKKSDNLAIFYAKTQMGWKEPKDENEKALNVNVTCEIPDNQRVKK
jgi:hypothetical protein